MVACVVVVVVVFGCSGVAVHVVVLVVAAVAVVCDQPTVTTQPSFRCQRFPDCSAGSRHRRRHYSQPARNLEDYLQIDDKKSTAFHRTDIKY